MAFDFRLHPRLQAVYSDGSRRVLVLLESAATRMFVPRMARHRNWAAALLIILLTPSAAFADPCEGPLPLQNGAHFSGRVRYVGDGDGLCVGVTSDPATWIEVRVADFNAPEMNTRAGHRAKAALKRIALGRPAACVTRADADGKTGNYDRVFAVCRIAGRSVGDALRAAGIQEGGR